MEAAKGRVNEVGVSPALVGVAPGVVVEGTVVLAVENLHTDSSELRYVYVKIRLTGSS